MSNTNVRNTMQRSIVLSTVRSLTNHPTADDVYAEIYKQHPTISRGTVYRNLNMLAKTKQILKLEIPDSADRFDFKIDRHYHIKCVECGEFRDLYMDYIEDLNDRVSTESNYILQDHDIVFKGICTACQQ